MRCNKCGSKMIIKCGKYGFFGSCTNFPACKNNLRLNEIIFNILTEERLNIYSWEKECWKCKGLTPIYTYMINKQLVPHMQMGYQIGSMGIGSVKKIDDYLIKNFPNINNNFSKTLGRTCASNNCVHCGALQGNNYVVDDPHEIFDDWLIGDVDKYIVKKIDIKDISLTPSDFTGREEDICQLS